MVYIMEYNNVLGWHASRNSFFGLFSGGYILMAVTVELASVEVAALPAPNTAKYRCIASTVPRCPVPPHSPSNCSLFSSEIGVRNTTYSLSHHQPCILFAKFLLMTPRIELVSSPQYPWSRTRLIASPKLIFGLDSLFHMPLLLVLAKRL
jgi:hypothetical protein